MTGPKTNERPGTRAQVRQARMSATKARVVLDLIRNKSVEEAADILTYTERAAAEVIGKCLDSAVANAEHNDEIDPETLYVSACYADEGRTLYRYRPRARGRATRIRKRTCHITVIVSPMPADMLERERAKREAIPGSRAARRRGQEAADRAARVAASQDHDDHDHDHDHDDHEHEHEHVAETAEAEGIVDSQAAAAEIADEAIEAAEATEETTESEEVAEEASEPSASEADSNDEESSSVPTGSDEERSDDDGASDSDDEESD